MVALLEQDKGMAGVSDVGVLSPFSFRSPFVLFRPHLIPFLLSHSPTCHCVSLSPPLSVSLSLLFSVSHTHTFSTSTSSPLCLSSSSPSFLCLTSSFPSSLCLSSSLWLSSPLPLTSLSYLFFLSSFNLSLSYPSLW